MNNSNLFIITKPLFNFLHRYHVIVFALLVVGGLAFAVYSINTILQISNNTSLDQGVTSGFDTATIQRIDKLQTRTDNQSLQLPAGRTNPFVE